MRSGPTLICYGLNRMVTRKHIGGATPDITFAYDDSSIPNSVGRLTSVTTASLGATPATARSITGYDALGRILGVAQTIGASMPITVSHAWKPAGMWQETYPSGRVVSFSFDGAGRVNSATGVLAGNAPVQYGTNILYAPQGAVASITLGNMLTETTAFNARLQPCLIQVGPSTSPSLCSSTASPPAPQAGSLLGLGYGYGGTNDNGNVLGIAITRGTQTLIPITILP